MNDGEMIARHAFRYDALDLVAGPNRNGRLDNDHGEILDDFGDRARGVVHIVHVGGADFGQRWRSDGDEDRLRAASGLLETGREDKALRAPVGQHQFAETRFVDWHAAGAKAGDLVFIRVDADDLVSEIGQTGCGHQSDVACADHHNSHRTAPRNSPSPQPGGYIADVLGMPKSAGADAARLARRQAFTEYTIPIDSVIPVSYWRLRSAASLVSASVF